MVDFQNTLKSLGEEVTILKKAVSQCPFTGSDAPPKVQALKPKGFSGVKNVKELENFLWDIQQFFKVTHVPSGEKVSIISIHLSGDSKLCGALRWETIWS